MGTKTIHEYREKAKSVVMYVTQVRSPLASDIDQRRYSSTHALLICDNKSRFQHIFGNIRPPTGIDQKRLGTSLIYSNPMISFDMRGIQTLPSYEIGRAHV